MKLVLFPILIAFACLLAALYGALHNQVSYTVAPGYFDDFKFIQFRIDDAFHNRIGAGLVGVYASWWMGVVIGLPVYLIALRVKGTQAFVKAFCQAALFVVCITLSIGLLGLAATVYLVDPDLLLELSPNRPTQDPLAFARAGAMHDFSYIGGIVGLMVGLWTTRRAGRR